MKKFASLMLAGALCAGLATTAFAAGETVTIDNVTFTNVVRIDKKHATLTEGKWDSELNQVVDMTTTEDISIHYLTAGSSITVVGNEYGEFSDADWEELEEGVYCEFAGDIGGEGTWTITEDYPGRADVIHEIDHHIFYVVDLSLADQPSDNDGTYTAVKYDTWGQIALNNYGSYGAWKQLYKANNYVKLTEGTQITLPETLGKYTRIGAPVAKEGESLYTVKAGDTLGTIAAAKYGDLMQYKAIFERNADRLKNANTIYEGQVIVLPVLP